MFKIECAVEKFTENCLLLFLKLFKLHVLQNKSKEFAAQVAFNFKQNHPLF